MREMLQRLRLAESLLDRLAHPVSGGELQRIALTRALLVGPAMIFADEPTSRLDPITQRETMDLLLHALEERGSALLLVTHDEVLGRKVADRVVTLGAAA